MRLAFLNSWRAVEAVVRLGSMARAAEELAVTPAAVSARIRDLEDRIGRPLFLRESRGLVPTEALTDVQQRLSGGMAILAGVQRDLSSESVPRRIALAVTQTFAENWLPRHMPSLFAKTDGMDLRLDTRWDLVGIDEGGFDFAIRYMAAPGPEFGQVPLLPSGVVPVCTPDFASRYGLGPRTASLDGIPLVHVVVPTSDPDWCDWNSWGIRTGVTWTTDDAPRFTLTGSGRRVAMSGMGLVLGGLAEVLDDVAQGSLVMPLGRDSIIWAGFWHRLIWPSQRRLRPVQKVFRNWAAERAELDRASMAELFGPLP